jgi:hypothetical protein
MIITPNVMMSLFSGQEEFTERDVEVFMRYLTFCGIGKYFFCTVVFYFVVNLSFQPPQQVSKMLNSLRIASSSIRGIRSF